jgi:replicative DNA helicase
MTGTRATRLALLQGLMDTDGTAGKDGSVSFSTSSKVLAKQVVDLVRSLGGGCADFSTKKTTHLDSYRIYIKFDNPQDSFRLSRKKDRLPMSNQRTGTIRSVIDNITLSREVECQCISVSHPSKLYVTNDYVVTHNTFLGLWIAYNVYMHQKKNVVFISMEMGKPILTQRMAAILTKAKLYEVMTGNISTLKLTSILDTLNGLSELPQKLYFVEGALSSTTDQVESYIHMYKPELLVIDGAYLLQHKNPRLSKFERVGENIRTLKQLAEKYKIPILLSYQFNREASKKGKKGEEAGLEDIGSSDDIGQISSVVLALKQPESAETLKQRIITVIKGRSGGENTKININWDFDKLNFSEIGDDSEEILDETYKETASDEDPFND